MAGRVDKCHKGGGTEVTEEVRRKISEGCYTDHNSCL
jgi:hypothetical protein